MKRKHGTLSFVGGRLSNWVQTSAIKGIAYFSVCHESLADLLLKADPSLTTKTAADILKAMKLPAVLTEARDVTHAKLLQIRQSSD